MTRLEPVVFNGRYELHRRLGRGGMAEVYLAHDQMLDRPVAVKVLFPALAFDPGFVERFRREAQSAAGLNHPNIVGVFDWGEANGTYFIVMEYVEGESLAELIDREGRLQADRAAEIGVGIASALGFAHRTGEVIHRDVKPGNVLITREGDVKVADFGIARAISDSSDQNLTKTGSVMGTATYFSPEQARGGDVDPRTDIYSLGCVLYEMIAGRPPFSGDNAVAIAYKHVQEAPVAPRRIDPAIPETLEAIILKTLAKNPVNRYPSAKDLRSDLRRYREGARIMAEPVLAPPVDPDATGLIAPPIAPGAAPGTTDLLASLADPAATEVMSSIGDTDPTRAEERTTVGRPRHAARSHDDHDGDYDEDDEDEEPLRSPAVLVLLVVLLLVMVGLLFVGARALGGGDADRDAADAADVSVPRVIDMPADQAKVTVENTGLTVQVVTEANEAPQGIVFAQDPGPGQTVAEGSQVTLHVSGGPAAVPVPDVKGKTQDEAIQIISDAGLVPSPKQVENDTVAVGMVIDTNPPAGTQSAPGTTIEIQVSGGPSAVAVPDVTNQPEAQARATLEGAGFTVTTTQQPNGGVAPGTVIGTNPPAGATAPRGSTITMVVAGFGQGGQAGTVPDVQGLDEGAARHQLEQAGYQVTTTEQPVDRRRWDGRVVGQNPPGGTPAPPGSVVTIVIGRNEGFDFG